MVARLLGISLGGMEGMSCPPLPSLKLWVGVSEGFRLGGPELSICTVGTFEGA